MTPIRIFISSVQKEFTQERAHIREYLRNDPLLRRFCDVFLFEDVPAKDRLAGDVYLDEVDRCTIYLGLFGVHYGNLLSDGRSPTHKEFLRATEQKKHRLIFVKGDSSMPREPKMAHLIQQAESQLIRRRFMTIAELMAGIYASIVDYLSDKGLLRFSPFDTTVCNGATIADQIRSLQSRSTLLNTSNAWEQVSPTCLHDATISDFPNLKSG